MNHVLPSVGVSRSWTATLGLLMLVVGCTDTAVLSGPDGGALLPDEPFATGPYAGTSASASLTRLECVVDVGALNLSCEEPGARAGGAEGPAGVVVGGQHQFVRLTSTNVATNDGVLSADVTVQNLTLKPLGTTDGVTPHADGVRVFFHTGPTNGVEVRNPSGNGSFTGSSQPYHEYAGGLLGGDGILTQGEVSGVRSWEFNLNSQTTFSFSVLISAEAPSQGGLGISLTSIDLGDAHSCGLTAGGQAYCWGFNEQGQLGDGTLTTRGTPTAVDQSGVAGGSFLSIVAGATHSCGLTAGGQAYCWGSNWGGQLGDGTTTDRDIPTSVDQSVGGGVSFASISAGPGNYTCGLTSGGQAYCWGENPNGQLGDGTYESRSIPTAVDQSMGGGVSSISAGVLHTCALTSAGEAYCWGMNFAGGLGDGTLDGRPTPAAVDQSVGGGVSFASISAGSLQTCALTAGGTAYCWGANWTGQLGDGTTTNRTTPTAVDQTEAGSFASVWVGNHSCGRNSGGEVYCWGFNGSGQLGDGTVDSRTTPTLVNQGAVIGGGLASISIAQSHSCGLTSGGQAYCWGRNDSGQLGDGTTTDRLLPTRVAGTR